MRKFYQLIVILLLTIAAQCKAVVIDTYSSWSSAGSLGWIGFFGEGIYLETSSFQTFGQSFTVGEDTVLDNFTFYFNDHVNPEFVDFETYVMQWDGNKAVGEVLFQSPRLTTSNNHGQDGFEEIFIETNLTLVEGQRYIAFFTTSAFLNGQTGTAVMGSWENSYDGGNIFILRNGANFNQVTSSDWISTFGDAAFVMNFSSTTNNGHVPEPSTIFLLGLGFLAIRSRHRHFDT